MITHVFLSFFNVLQVFQTYITSVSSGYCKSRSDIAHIAMCVRSERGTSGLCVRFDGLSIVRAAQASRGRMKCRLVRGVLARALETKYSVGVRPNIRAIAQSIQI
jgi:hypothetical protein